MTIQQVFVSLLINWINKFIGSLKYKLLEEGYIDDTLFDIIEECGSEFRKEKIEKLLKQSNKN